MDKILLLLLQLLLLVQISFLSVLVSTVEAYSTKALGGHSGYYRYCRYQFQQRYQIHHHHHHQKQHRLYQQHDPTSDDDCCDSSSSLEKKVEMLQDWLSCIKHIISAIFGGFKNRNDNTIDDVDNIYLHGTLLCASAVSYYDDIILPPPSLSPEEDDEETKLLQDFYKRIQYLPGYPITISGGVRTYQFHTSWYGKLE